VKMIHPEIEAAADVISREQFMAVYAPRGWELADPATEFANDRLGRFVRSPDDLTLNEARALIATNGGDYPDGDATEKQVLATYKDMFGDRPLAPVAATETAAGVPIELYDPSAYNVDEVIAHLAEVDETEQIRILEAEEAGKNRVTITGWTPAPAESADQSTPVEDEEK
jgi:hypothetical protein